LDLFSICYSLWIWCCGIAYVREGQSCFSFVTDSMNAPAHLSWLFNACMSLVFGILSLTMFYRPCQFYFFSWTINTSVAYAGQMLPSTSVENEKRFFVFFISEYLLYIFVLFFQINYVRSTNYLINWQKRWTPDISNINCLIHIKLKIEVHLVERKEIMDQISWTVLWFDMQNRHVFVMAGERRLRLGLVLSKRVPFLFCFFGMCLWWLVK
jgi:hypothetical protein